MDGAQVDLGDLSVNREGEVPIGVQLAWALRARIGDGRLAPGGRLPGLRELAEMVGVNANTARAVYQRLEQEGLVESRQGTGTFVASIAPEPSAVGKIAADAARQARKTGVDPREVAAALYMTGETPVGETALAGERRRELRAQIAALEGTLSEIQALNPGLISTPSKRSRRAGPRLLNVDELEQVRTQLVRRLAQAELAEATSGGQALSPVRKRARAEAGQAKSAGPTESDRQAKGAAQANQPGRANAGRSRPSTRPSTA